MCRAIETADCFSSMVVKTICHVEVQQNPQLKGQPVATVQYGAFGDLRTIS